MAEVPPLSTAQAAMQEARWDTPALWLYRTSMNYGWSPDSGETYDQYLDELARRETELQKEAAAAARDFWTQQAQKNNTDSDLKRSAMQAATSAGVARTSASAQASAATAGAQTEAARLYLAQAQQAENSLQLSEQYRKGVDTLAEAARTTENNTPSLDEINKFLIGVPPHQRSAALQALQAQGVDVARASVQEATAAGPTGTKDTFDTLVAEGSAKAQDAEKTRNDNYAAAFEIASSGLKAGYSDPNLSRFYHEAATALGIVPALPPPEGDQAKDPQAWQVWADATMGPGQVTINADEKGQVTWSAPGYDTPMPVEALPVVAAKQVAQGADPDTQARLDNQLRPINSRIEQVGKERQKVQAQQQAAQIDPYTRWYNGVINDPNFQNWKKANGYNDEAFAVSEYAKMGLKVQKEMRRADKQARRTGEPPPPLTSEQQAALNAVQTQPGSGGGGERALAEAAGQPVPPSGIPESAQQAQRQAAAQQEGQEGTDALPMEQVEGPAPVKEADFGSFEENIQKQGGVLGDEASRAKEAAERQSRMGTMKTVDLGAPGPGIMRPGSGDDEDEYATTEGANRKRMDRLLATRILGGAGRSQTR